MQKAKQCHSDASTCVVSYTQDTWKIEVLVPRPKGSTVLKIADVRVRNLEEAILLRQQAMTMSLLWCAANTWRLGCTKAVFAIFSSGLIGAS